MLNPTDFCALLLLVAIAAIARGVVGIEASATSVGITTTLGNECSNKLKGPHSKK